MAAAAKSKQLIRKEIRKQIAAMSRKQLQLESQMVSDIIRKLPQYQNAKCVACFVSIHKKEIETDSLLKYCFEDKKKVYLPRVIWDKGHYNMSMLHTQTFEEIYDDTKFTQSKWGIREPMLEYNEVLERNNAMNALDLDLIIVPGVAFNTNNYRLGQGKGFYDRYFMKYKQLADEKKKTFPYLLGIALSMQLVQDIPIQKHDWILDKVVFPK